MRKMMLPVLFGILGGTISHLALDAFSDATSEKPESTLAAADPLANYSMVTRSVPVDGAVDFQNASSVATPSVVYIKTVSESRRSVSYMDWFFGGGGGTQQVINSGSGVIFTEDGHIVTNNHVIEHAEQIQVIIGKRPYDAKLVGVDPSTDLAVLKIEGGSFPAIRKGSSRTLGVGEWVLAVGNPFNLNSTVTAGIVSAKGRDIGIVRDQFPLESFIQTDAAINPGNSGGALVNLKGELVGVNTAIISRTGYYSGYGFAVPVDIVEKVVGDLIRYGKVQKAFIEAEVSDLDYDLAGRLGIEDLEGVVVTHLHQGGAAEKTGIKAGDIILAINNDPIRTKSNFEEAVSYLNPGDKVKVKFKRDKEIMVKEIMLRNENGTTEVMLNNRLTSPTLGGDFEDATKQERELYSISHGVKILNIRSGMLSRIGIEDGFILMSVNDQKVNSAEDAIKMLENTKGRVVLKGISRNGVSGYYSYYY